MMSRLAAKAVANSAFLVIVAVARTSFADFAPDATPRKNGPTHETTAPIHGGLFERLFSPGRQAPATPPHPAVVRVIVPERNGASYGSGTLVDVRDEFGLVVTNWHVVCDLAGAPTVVFPDGFRSAAQVVKVDREWDLAALVIWKPRVSPVPLAERAPRPGEKLAIAGYGGGPYRLVEGPCTQYVAPGMNQPWEMVELAASARQGDSGGPIFNSQGELAGVLFGEGHGRTAGSYCGRVRSFLTSVLPDASSVSTAASVDKKGPPAVATNPEIAYSEAMVSHSPAVLDRQAIVESGSDAPWLARPTALESPTRLQESDVPAAGGSAEAVTNRDALDFRYFAGPTRLEQLKTILAAVGALTLVIRVCRVLGGRRSSRNS
jgi:S1-C subfamily serine protease